jgi:hypothetical protein
LRECREMEEAFARMLPDSFRLGCGARESESSSGIFAWISG